MDHPEGAGKSGGVRLGFDRRVRLEFHGSKISSDGGLLLYWELDEVLSLHDMAGGLLKDVRKGRNCVHTLVGFCVSLSLVALLATRTSMTRSV